jgi:hypothetical protein
MAAYIFPPKIFPSNPRVRHVLGSVMSARLLHGEKYKSRPPVIKCAGYKLKAIRDSHTH